MDQQQRLDVLATAPPVINSPTREPLVPEDQCGSPNQLETANELGANARDFRFGFFWFHPDWLQIFRNAKFFTLLLCLFSLVEGAIISGNADIRYHSALLLRGFNLKLRLSRNVFVSKLLHAYNVKKVI